MDDVDGVELAPEGFFDAVLLGGGGTDGGGGGGELGFLGGGMLSSTTGDDCSSFFDLEGLDDDGSLDDEPFDEDEDDSLGA